jgi:hypothetical protein
LLIGLAGCGEQPRRASAPVPRGVAYAGPALVGDTVVWGEMLPDKSGVIVSRAPGHAARVIARFPAKHGKGNQRNFGGIPGALDASPSRTAYVLVSSHAEGHGDVVEIMSSVRPRVSIGGARFTNPLPRCHAAYVSTAVDGDDVAIGMTGGNCQGVWLGGRRISSAEAIREVRLAGPWVAWLEDDRRATARRIVVADRATGAVAATFTKEELGGDQPIDRFDLDDQGHLVALQGGRVIVTSLGDRTPHVIATHAWPNLLAAAGGRVAYATERDGYAHRLILAGLDGTKLRTLERYGKARQPAGEIALTDRRAAWSIMLARGDAAGGNVIRRARGAVRTASL